MEVSHLMVYCKQRYIGISSLTSTREWLNQIWQNQLEELSCTSVLNGLMIVHDFNLIDTVL